MKNAVKTVSFTEQTPFERDQENLKLGKLKTPYTTVCGKEIDYFGYQLATHVGQLRLKGKSAKECLPQLKQLLSNYKLSLTSKAN